MFKRVSNIVIILSVFGCGLTYTYSQSKVNFVEGNIAISKPSGYFAENISKSKIGAELGFLRQLKIEKPLFWGVSVYYHVLGSGSAEIIEVLDFQVVDFNYTTNSQMLGFNGKMRIYPDLRLGNLEFYAEALLGYKWFFTKTRKTIIGDGDSFDSFVEKGDVSLTYGVALGLNYPCTQNLYLNLRVNYLPGLSIPYYVKNNVTSVNYSSIEFFDIKRSTTDIIRWDMGVTWKFTKLFQ